MTPESQQRPPIASPPRDPATGTVCAICQSPFADNDATVSCPACQAKYHADCWTENCGCAVYGCSEVPATEGRRAIEIPVGYWGQENKPCPVCKQTILAAAVRCRHCGTAFQTARPLESDEFAQTKAWEAQAPAMRKRVILFSILAVIPLTAPVGIIILFAWYLGRRQDVEKLPSLYPALVKIGLTVGVLETVGFVILSLLYTVFNGGKDFP